MIEWIITASILIVIVIALRFILRAKINPRLQYAIWGIVLLRLLIPFHFGNSIMSVINLSDKVQEQTAVQTVSHLTQTNIPARSYESAYQQIVRQYESRGVDVSALERSELESLDKEAQALMAGTSVAELLKTVFLYIWIAGMVIVGAFLIIANLRFSSGLKRTRQPLRVSGCQLPVYVAKSIETPCLYGVKRPKIYVTPEAADNKRILRHVLAHETTHYRHGDHIWSVLRGVCLALHWYNPFVWWAAHLSRNDSELACDEGTIKRIGEQERIEYGRTLIGLTCQKHTNLLLAATTMTGSKNSIKERIMMIAKKPKMAVYTIVAVILIAAVAVGCTFTGAQESKDETINKEENESISEAETVSQDAAKAEAITIKTDIQGEIPVEMLDWAMEYVQQDIDYYNKLGAYPSHEEFSYTITDAKITGLKRINTGTASLTTGVDMYLLEYSLLPDKPENVRLEGGMTMADGWITEKSITGQPYLVMSWAHTGEETTRQRICVTDTSTITQVYGTPEMIEQYGNAYTAAAMELYKNLDGSYGDSLDVIAAMKTVKASDFTNPTDYGNVTAEELAYALNTAIEKQINEADAISASYGGYVNWQIESAYLEGGPGFWEGTDLHFSLRAGLAENIVEVQISKDSQYDNAYFEDAVLYDMVRHSGDYEEVIDKAVFAKFEDILVPQMENSLAEMSENAGSFTGYQLTRFQLLWSYENQSDGSRVELYDFNYALLTDHPEDVVMAGGTYIDSELRIQGFYYPGQFIVKYRGDEVVCTTFLNENNHFDLPQDADYEVWLMEHINNKLDLVENSQS